MKDKIWSLCLTEWQEIIFSIVRYFPQGIVYFLAKKEKNGDEWYDIIILWYTLHPINHIWNIRLPGEKSSKKHEQMTSPLMPNTCTERGHEAQYKKWRAGWCALVGNFFFIGKIFDIVVFFIGTFLRSKKERVSFIETFFDKVEEMVIAGNICQRPHNTQGASFPTPC